MAKTTFVDVHGTACPYCRAPRKAPCKTNSGAKTTFHIARHLAAIKLSAAKEKAAGPKVTLEPTPTPVVNDYRVTEDSVINFLLVIAMMSAFFVLMGAVLYLIYQ